MTIYLAKNMYKSIHLILIFRINHVLLSDKDSFRWATWMIFKLSEWLFSHSDHKIVPFLEQFLSSIFSGIVTGWETQFSQFSSDVAVIWISVLVSQGWLKVTSTCYCIKLMLVKFSEVLVCQYNFYNLLFTDCVDTQCTCSVSPQQFSWSYTYTALSYHFGFISVTLR